MPAIIALRFAELTMSTVAQYRKLDMTIFLGFESNHSPNFVLNNPNTVPTPLT
jgi:hypothetical protein